MRTRPLRELALTELGLGGSPIGNHRTAISDEQAVATIDAAWAGGVRYFDTAPHYGLGLAETRLGAALRGRPRADFVVSTKVGRLLEPNPAPTGSDLAAGFDVPDTYVRRFDFSRDGVRRSLDGSLTRLALDRVDIVFVHDADDHVDEAVRQALPALVELREQSVVGAVGVGMNQWQSALEIVDRADVDVVMLAGRWTLLDRSGAPLLERCAARGVRLIAAAPFNSGLLADDRPQAQATLDYAPVPEQQLGRARALADVCADYGFGLPAAALQFALRCPTVVAVVAGLRTPAEVRTALANMAVDVPAEAWDRLDAVALAPA
jgi:D-threo-aldose 1-dehydrogenase